MNRNMVGIIWSVILVIGLTFNPKYLKNISPLDVRNYKYEYVYNKPALLFSPSITMKKFYGKTYSGSVYIKPMLGIRNVGNGDKLLWVNGGQIGVKINF